MVGLRENDRMLAAIKEWRLKPEGMGKKYMGIESFSWHMSVYPVFFEDDLEARVRIRTNEHNPMSGCSILYVIDIKNERVVYSRDIDELEPYSEETLEMLESMVKMSDDVVSAMRNRENELYEFRQLQRELQDRISEEMHRRLAERYAHHVKEAELLGYQIKTYHEFMNNLSDEDKNYIQGAEERSII